MFTKGPMASIHLYTLEQSWTSNCVTRYRYVYSGNLHTRGEPKIRKFFFLVGRGAVLPSAPAWCLYMTALHISWLSGVLEERSIRSVWLFSWASVIVFINILIADLKEQRVYIKFCFGLGKTAVETVTLIREFAKKKFWARQGFTNGVVASNVLTCDLKTNRDLDVLQKA